MRRVSLLEALVYGSVLLLMLVFVANLYFLSGGEL